MVVPFAGQGAIHELRKPIEIDTVGVEIEAERAGWQDDTIVADANDLPVEIDTFDAIVTPPCLFDAFRPVALITTTRRTR